MRAVELFAGAGGLAIGLSQAGFKPARVVEWDRWCCDTIRANRLAGVAPVGDWPEPEESDVRALDFRALSGAVDLVSGGPPCQPFSVGGQHRAHDDARDMWPEAVRAVREIAPRAFVFENVKGLTRAGFATYLQYVVRQLEAPELSRGRDEDWADHLARLERHHTSGARDGLAYRVVYRVLNAADFGVPQKRERVVFVGFRSDLDIAWSFPEPTHSREALLWDQARGGYWDRHRVPGLERSMDISAHSLAMQLPARPRIKPWRTVRDAIEGLPDPERDASRGAEMSDHRFQPGARSYPGHTGSPLDEPAKTLKAGVHGVPGGENMLVRSDGTIRYFTVRESARLQTFPDNYRFHGAWSEAMRQLGNAVPATLAHAVGTKIARELKRAGA